MTPGRRPHPAGEWALRLGWLLVLVLVVCSGCGDAGPGPSPVTASPGRSRPAGPPDARPRVLGGRSRREIGPSVGHLLTAAGGVVLVESPETSEEASQALAPVAGSASWTWTPAGPLPAPEPSRRHVDVFYTPHPDDETLSMGLLIAAAVQRGDRVVVVALTDGRTTGARRTIDARLRALHPDPTRGRGLTQDDIAAARVGELRRAAGDLGVHGTDLFLAHLDAPGTDHGALVTVAEAAQVMSFFAARFPGATHVTMSNVAERQLDHLDAGVALRQLLDDGVVTSAQWTVSRLWWQLSSPAWTWVLPGTVVLQRVRRALHEYGVWDPGHREYAVGLTSVRWQFAALVRDVRNRVHGTGPTSPGVVAPPEPAPGRAHLSRR